MRLGLLQFNGQVYNLNPMPVTYNGVTYMPAQCPSGPCDPRGIGINPLVQQMWNKYVPLSNETGCGSQRVAMDVNIAGIYGQHVDFRRHPISAWLASTTTSAKSGTS